MAPGDKVRAAEGTVVVTVSLTGVPGCAEVGESEQFNARVSSTSHTGTPTNRNRARACW
jgi:hypothetical protein